VAPNERDAPKVGLPRRHLKTLDDAAEAAR
jgi:hypothetical protein